MAQRISPPLSGIVLFVNGAADGEQSRGLPARLPSRGREEGKGQMKKSVKSSGAQSAKALPDLSEEDIQTCLTHAQAIADVLAPYAVTLTTVQRRAQAKYRKEGDTVIPVLARLATASGLASTALDVDGMQKQVALANVLQPLHTSVKTLSDTIGDTILSSHGGAWTTAVTLHGALLRVSKKNLTLRRDMEAVQGAFTRRKKATAETAAAPAATGSATPAASTEPSAPQVQPVTAAVSKGA
jgi:hypothetical protein